MATYPRTETDPVATAALAQKQSISEKGQANGYASLDASARVPAAQLPATTGDQFYVHTQSTASAVWTISHPLAKDPSVTIVDSGGNELFADVEYLSPSVIEVTHGTPHSGKAFLN